MGHLHVWSVNSSKDLGFSGSKFLSSKIDWNLAFLEVGVGPLRVGLFGEVDDWLDCLDGALASKFNLWALPITAFRVVSPRASAIWLAVWPLDQSSFNLATFSSVQLIVYNYNI